ncbi:MAG TPA: tol-pal system-associated acyl-CoA thioesterase [Nevskiaceae bacterium]|nr:tol-pal system-associated acyl-CoA thioesterase [Nevskiaceae bacterium]
MSAESIFRLRVYYEDTDVSGVVYHANYLRWFERARTEWLRALALGQEELRVTEGVAFTVANLSIDYLKPARLDDELQVMTVISEMGRASLGFSQRVQRAGELLARAQVRVGCVDAASFKPRRLPAGVKWNA